MDKKEVIVPIGPYHPLLEEPEFFKLFCEGEKVVDIDWLAGMNHRGIEKISEGKSYDQVPFLVERICGICSTSHPLAFVNAVENLVGLEIPERAKYIRTFVAEMERIHSHLLWMGLAGHFLGYNTVFMWAWKWREPALDIMELVTGNRNNYAMMCPGGVRRDMSEEDFPFIQSKLDEIKSKVAMLAAAVPDDPVLLARLKGVGILTAEDIHNYGAIGPVARASGVAIDVRRDDPYAAYDRLDWEVITEPAGDLLARTNVRLLEILESVKILEQCLARLKETKSVIMTKVREVPPGEGIGHVEAPRGECFHYIRSDGTNRPVRHKIRAPSSTCIPTFEKSVVGGQIADALITLAGVDPCYCCTERLSAIAEDGKTLDGETLLRLSIEKTKKLKQIMGRG